MRESQENTKQELAEIVELFETAPNRKDAYKAVSTPKQFSGRFIIITVFIVSAIIGFIVWYSVKPECNIKGNIDAKTGERFYYMPFDPYYKSVKITDPSETWLCSEKEAIDAGWKRKRTLPSQKH